MFIELSDIGLAVSPLGTSLASRDVRLESANWAKADIHQVARHQPRFYESRPTSPVSRGGALCSSGPRASWGNCPTPTSGTQRVLISVCQKYLGPKNPKAKGFAIANASQTIPFSRRRS